VPALAIETRVVWTYSKPDRGEQDLVRLPATHRECLEEGWRFQGEEVHRRVLFINDEGWISDHEEFRNHVAFRLDQQELQRLIDQEHVDVLSAMERSEKVQAKPVAAERS
jgi:hypothetical protein